MNSAEWCIVGIIFAGSVLMFGIIINEIVTPEDLELATCDDLTKLIKNSDYGVEYHNEWIIKECWK